MSSTIDDDDDDRSRFGYCPFDIMVCVCDIFSFAIHEWILKEKKATGTIQFHCLMMLSKHKENEKWTEKEILYNRFDWIFFLFFLVSIQSHTHTQRHIPKNKQQQKFVRFTWLNFKYQNQKNSLNYASVGCFFYIATKVQQQHDNLSFILFAVTQWKKSWFWFFLQK